jgi:AcrR family transcriptional regulator
MKNQLSPLETKNAILEAAIIEFTEKGMGKTRTDEIAKKAGVAAGLVHYHFKSKNNLYKEAIKTLFDTKPIEELTIFAYNQEITLEQKLFSIVYALVKSVFSIKAANTIKFIYRLLLENDNQFHDFINEHEFFEDLYLAKLIEDGIQSGIFEETNAIFVAISTMDTICNQYLRFITLKETKVHTTFYPGNFEKEFFTYYIKSFFKSLHPSNREVIIPEIPDDLKSTIDSFIEKYNHKNVFGSYPIIIHFLAKIFNDHPKQK